MPTPFLYIVKSCYSTLSNPRGMCEKSLICQAQWWAEELSDNKLIKMSLTYTSISSLHKRSAEHINIAAKMVSLSPLTPLIHIFHRNLLSLCLPLLCMSTLAVWTLHTCLIKTRAGPVQGFEWSFTLSWHNIGMALWSQGLRVNGSHDSQSHSISSGTLP